EPHPAYDFFAPRPLLGYAGNPNNNNGWIEADVPLLGELEAVANNRWIHDEEVYEVNEEWMMAPVTPPPMPAVPPPSIYKVEGPSTAAAEGQSFLLLASRLLVPPSVIENLSTRLGNMEYRHGQLVKKVIQVSDAEVAAGITIGEIGPRISTVEGQVRVMASQMVYATDRWEQVGAQVEQGQRTATQRDEVQTMVLEMSSRESTLMQCILWMDRQLADLERRPPRPQ
nr:hypothetical protein [Tanacetum cinerariifolium]